jgi:D-alanine-D-alanine ligase
MRVKLGVIFGGVSVEHEVSIITAIQAMNSIDTAKYDVVPIYIAKDGIWYSGAMLKDIKIYNDMDLLKRYAHEVVLYKKENRFVLQSKTGFIRREIEELDMCFPIMHGTYGEDGALQGYLETVGIPYAESDHYAATVGQDKVFMKQIWKDSGVPVVKYEWFFDYDYQEDPDKVIEKCEKLTYPMIVKPARLGSSVGISVAHNEQELREAIDDAVSYDTKILVEEMVQNLVEVNISVLGNYRKQKLSVIEEVGGSKDFLTYADKYQSGSKSKVATENKGMASAKRIIPARISEELKKKVNDIAIKAFRSLNSSGVVRIDFLIDKKENKVYANEINSIPGSLSFYLWDKTEKNYQELLSSVLNIGIRDYKDRVNKTHTFDTNILSNFDGKGLKGIKGVKK